MVAHLWWLPSDAKFVRVACATSLTGNGAVFAVLVRQAVIADSFSNNTEDSATVARTVSMSMARSKGAAGSDQNNGNTGNSAGGGAGDAGGDGGSEVPSPAEDRDDPVADDPNVAEPPVLADEVTGSAIEPSQPLARRPRPMFGSATLGRLGSVDPASRRLDQEASHLQEVRHRGDVAGVAELKERYARGRYAAGARARRG